MKKIVLVLLIGFSISAFAQKVRGAKVDIENLVAKNWDVEYALMSGLVIKKLPVNTDFEISLTKKGTFQITKANDEVIEGVWVYNSKMYYIVLLDNDIIVGKISKVEAQIMELTLMDNKEGNVNLSNIKVILKPI